MTAYVFTPKAMQTATDGVWHNLVDFTATRIITDTRKLQAGDVFLAIVGENFDGHHFAQTASEQGAVAVICQRPLSINLPQLIVSDTRLALGDLARHRRQAHPDLTVVAITGSSGKTTTKEMLGSILSNVGKTLITKGNLNNDLGVPMMVLELSDEHRFAVFELGANHAGEIAYTADIVKPSVACVLNIGNAHLGEFGGQDNIANAKAEIFSALGQAGVAVVPFDNDYGDFLKQQALKYTQKILTFGDKVVPVNKAGIDWAGLSSDERAFFAGVQTVELAGDVFADEVHLLDNGCEFSLNLNGLYGDGVQSQAITLPFVGRHNVDNAAAAAAAAAALGVDLDTIATGFKMATPAKGRLTHSSLTTDGVTHLLIDDTYNANPVSVLVSADVLCSKTGQKILVLGDIGELGEKADYEHKRLGEKLAKNWQEGKQIDCLITVGELMRHCHTAAKAVIDGRGLAMMAYHFENKSQAGDFLKSLLQTPCTILFKGSRSQKMETMIDELKAKSQNKTNALF